MKRTNPLTKIRRLWSTRGRYRKKRKWRISPFKKQKKGGLETNETITRLKKLGILLLVMLTTTGIIYWVVLSLYRVNTLRLQTAYGDSPREGLEWDGKRRLYILLVGLDRREDEFGYVDAASILMMDPTTNTVGIFNVNVDTAIYLPVHGKYESIRNLYNLMLLTNEDIPIRGTMNGVGSLLSLPIDRYILMDEEGMTDIVNSLGGVYINNEYDFQDKDLYKDGLYFHLSRGNFKLGGSDLVRFVSADDDGSAFKFNRHTAAIEGIIKKTSSIVSIIKFPWIAKSLEKDIYTDFSKKEVVKLAQAFLSIKEVKNGSMRATSVRAVEKGGEIVKLPVYEDLDKLLGEVFIDKDIIKEQARVEIYNSTSSLGLANLRARYLKNIGIDVIRTGDSPEPLDTTTIYTKDAKRFTHTIDTIERMFSEEVAVKEEEVSFVHTGDIVVIIGKNALDEDEL